MNKVVDKYKGQQILVIDNPDFLLAKEGWVSKGFEVFFEAPVIPTFILRNEAEYNKAYRQIIPYAVVHSLDTDKYLSYSRKGTETRLHNSISLGLGGHIDKEDYEAFNGGPIALKSIIALALTRELLEEVPNITTTGKGPENAEFKGFIYSDANDVDAVHLGVVAQIDVETEFVASSEEVEGEWLTLDEIKEKYDLLENWSKVVVDNCITKQ